MGPPVDELPADREIGRQRQRARLAGALEEPAAENQEGDSGPECEPLKGLQPEQEGERGRGRGPLHLAGGLDQDERGREGSIDMFATISTPASLATRPKIALAFTISGRSGLPTNKAARTPPNAAVTA